MLESIIDTRHQSVDIVGCEQHTIKMTGSDRIFYISRLIGRVALAVGENQVNAKAPCLILGMGPNGLKERIRCVRKADEDRLVLSEGRQSLTCACGEDRAEERSLESLQHVRPSLRAETFSIGRRC